LRGLGGKLEGSGMTKSSAPSLCWQLASSEIIS
jgi:hypothetical protein